MAFEAKSFVRKKLAEIKKQVGTKGAVVATSGGVDSMTCAVLAHRALGKKAVILFIDGSDSMVCLHQRHLEVDGVYQRDS